VTKVAPGELLSVDTISHEGILADQGRDPVEFFGRYGVNASEVLDDAIALAGSDRPHDQTRDGPHVLTGPIWIDGAKPGDVVVVETVALMFRVPYGIVSNRHGKGALPGELPEPGPAGEIVPLVTRFATVEGTGPGLHAVVHGPTGANCGHGPTGANSGHGPTGANSGHGPTGANRGHGPARARGLGLPLRPFLGFVGVSPGVETAHSTPPGPHGGNLDVRLLGEGSRLHLPVRTEGALLQVGDPHFAQGDGEVALTALEGSLRAVLRVHLAKAARPSWDLPYGETDTSWILLGLHEDLNEAVRIATRAALSLVTERTGVDRATAYAWLSVAGDLSVSQVVDGVKGVHLSVPKAWLTRDDSAHDVEGRG
jgi:acetamidase/formamidase